MNTIIITFIYLAMAKPAYAYLDPGTGSYVFQLLVAGLLGGSFFMKSFFKKIFNKFKKQKNEDEPDKSK